LIFHLFKIEPGGGCAAGGGGGGGVTPQPASAEAEACSEYAMRCCEPGPGQGPA